MTQPSLAHATAYGRMYSRSTASAPEVPSITTIIGQEAKDLTGWAGHLAASELAADRRLSGAVGSASRLRSLARDASDAAARFRDAAAARGDRVHHYAEQVARRALGEPHEAESSRALLAERGEDRYADRFDEWWELYDVRPLAAEVTVWNHTLGYAGTLDLVAEIGGRRCLIDFKTKGLDRSGRAKALSDSVVMQLVAGLKAEESLHDAEAGVWEPWEHGRDAVLLAVAISEAETVPVQAVPEVLPRHWHKFWALRQVWEHTRGAAEAGRALRPIPPPPVPRPSATETAGSDAAPAAG
ncbi:MAG: cytochrome [Nesterenkonia sp.]|uniref:cytochrome n=1 Tax=Nesterenkonia marinintestina TaxID=2979865 RepID=UPI0021C0CBD0|nr:cytochrome [Nesterenkonia sp. GX14115]MDO5493922.1 cytochrome [Nesterenkonia sp.]